MIIHILILAFICLIIYQLLTLNIIEGLDDPSISLEPEPEPEPSPKPVSVPDSSEAGSSTSTPAPISTPANVVATPKSYQPYDSSNALILSQQNAGNISVLNQQLTTLSSQFNKTQTQSNKNTADITSLNDQMASISAAQTKYATSTTAAFTPPS